MPSPRSSPFPPVRYRMIRCILTCALLFCTTFASAAEVSLQMKYPPNTKRSYQIEQKTEQILTIGPQDVETKSTTFIVQNQAIGPKQPNGSVEMVEKVEVLQNTLDLPGGLTFQFDSANADKAADNPALEPVAKVMRVTFKTPVTSVIDSTGKLDAIRIPENALADLDDDFKSILDPERRKKTATQAIGFIPDKPVKTGDTWEQTIDADLGAGQTLSVTSTVTYQGTIDSKGKTLHKITHKPKSVSYAMDPNSKSPLKVTGSELTPTEGEGEILFNAEAGEIEQRSSSIRIQGKLTLDFGGQQVPGKLDLRLSDKTVKRP